MPIDRRQMMAGTFAAATLSGSPGFAKTMVEMPMYGRIGKMIAARGQRDALIAILLKGVNAMPGCLSYVVAADPADANAIWITEVWDSEASHKASLSLPAVRAAISRARPLIAGFGESFTTMPIGGWGLARS